MHNAICQAEFELERECSSADVLREASPSKVDSFKHHLDTFKFFQKKTLIWERDFGEGVQLPVYVNEFWTAKQRQGSRLHEVSYRACFKPQLPSFFIERLTRPGDGVYDPFMGRGTTLVEAALNQRIPMGCDINPLSDVFVSARLELPSIEDVVQRLAVIDFQAVTPDRDDLLVFYHPKTLQEICSLRHYFLTKAEGAGLDVVDKWIRLVATNRLTGHSTGFFSVYSLPPNQAVTVKSQQRINAKRNQVPPRRDVPAIIQKKSKQLLNISAKERETLLAYGKQGKTVIGSCDQTDALQSNSVDLVVTSPPFLDEVDYRTDNWLRCWFNGIDERTIPMWVLRKPEDWQAKMTAVLRELKRVLKPGGSIAFEVGEVRKGKVKLEDWVVPAGVAAGLKPELLLINSQVFTKTSNCWGVSNLEKGTNSNRIVLFSKL